jgi:transposase
LETAVTYATERLDHLGIVAGVCREIGLAEFLDEQAKGSRQRVTIGTATVAMVLNGLGFTNRRLYLVPQFFENKPLGRLLGAKDIQAADLNDDCLGRTLDWLHAHDVTRLFAGLALRARRVFGIESSQIHVDTTSFSVHGEYESAPRGEEATIALTYGYSREHRADLKQWMMALATTHEGDVPLLMRPLGGNSSDAHTLVAAVEALKEQLGAEEQEESPIFVADAGIYGEENMVRLAEAGVEWVSRVPRTSTAASSLIEEVLDAPEHHWRKSEDDGGGGVRLLHEARLVELPQGRTERWVVASSEEGLKRAKEGLERRLGRHQQEWEKKLWHLSNRSFACEADAREALKEATKRLPECLEVVGEPTCCALARVTPRAAVPPRTPSPPRSSGA